MKTKQVKNYVYTGLGFPISLQNVTMVMIDNEWHPKINVDAVADKTIKELAFRQQRLTGNQIKFIRTYLSMTLRTFAKNVVHESHTAVNKWEKFGDAITNMDINIEKMLKFYIQRKVIGKADEKFYDQLIEPDYLLDNTKISQLKICA